MYTTYARVWDEKRLVREGAHAAEPRVAPLPSESLDIATHDARAGNDPMNLPVAVGSVLGGRHGVTNTHHIYIVIINSGVRVKAIASRACSLAHVASRQLHESFRKERVFELDKGGAVGWHMSVSRNRYVGGRGGNC